MNTLAWKPRCAAAGLRLLLLLCCPFLLMGGCNPNQSGREQPGGEPPAAHTNGDQTVEPGATVTLDGSDSTDPEGESLSYEWRQVFGGPVALSSTASPVVTFRAPAKGTTLTFELRVSDGEFDATASARVSVRSNEPTVQVTEIRQPPVRDNPVLSGELPDGWTLAEMPDGPQNVGKGAPGWIDQLVYAPTAEQDLAPGATHELALDVGGNTGLIGTVLWIGTTDALPVTLAVDGVELDRGEAERIANDRGSADVRARAVTGGHATLSVTNTSTVTVQIRMNLAAAAL